MALGFGNRRSDRSSPSSSPSTEKTNPDGVFSSDQTAAENGGKKGIKMNRIDGPVTKPIAGHNVNGVADDSGTEDGMSIGKQMELEAGNAIKYRTCSWQKVRYSLLSQNICDRFIACFLFRNCNVC
jgi:hypothetical protein